MHHIDEMDIQNGAPESNSSGAARVSERGKDGVRGKGWRAWTRKATVSLEAKR
jgi:hypothetical protein